jgi:hypothetical protein
MLIAPGNVSFEDCDMLTWSFGWMGFLEPISPPAISIPRLEMTSFTFMFVCVPEPVCQTTSGKWSSRSPSITSRPARGSVGQFVRELPEVAVHLGGGVLHDAEAADERARHALDADLEVLQRTLRLGAPVAARVDLDRSERVSLDARSGHDPSPSTTGARQAPR